MASLVLQARAEKLGRPVGWARKATRASRDLKVLPEAWGRLGLSVCLDRLDQLVLPEPRGHWVLWDQLGKMDQGVHGVNPDFKVNRVNQELLVSQEEMAKKAKEGKKAQRAWLVQLGRLDNREKEVLLVCLACWANTAPTVLAVPRESRALEGTMEAQVIEVFRVSLDFQEIRVCRVKEDKEALMERMVCRDSQVDRAIGDLLDLLEQPASRVLLVARGWLEIPDHQDQLENVAKGVTLAFQGILGHLDLRGRLACMVNLE